MKIYAVIMAGGSGTRFWPRSRKAMPKQLLNIFGEQSMIQGTVKRLEQYIPAEHIFVITNTLQKPEIEKQLNTIPGKNIIAEPFGRNTAPCVGLSTRLIQQQAEDAIIVTLPADHLIEQIENFQKNIQLAAEFAYESKGLVTIGIKPHRPDTGYGYINYKTDEVSANVYKVSQFVEKPDLETAKNYLASGDYLWNAGMFIWRADVIMKEIERYIPALSKGLQGFNAKPGDANFAEALEKLYANIQSVSIDYGIMEKSDKVYVTKSLFDWSDVGSWETVYELSEKDSDGNVIQGEVFTSDSHNSYIHTPHRFTSVIGLDNVVVVDTGDALLICSRDKVQDVKKTVDYLTAKKNDILM